MAGRRSINENENHVKGGGLMVSKRGYVSSKNYKVLELIFLSRINSRKKKDFHALYINVIYNFLLL